MMSRFLDKASEAWQDLSYNFGEVLVKAGIGTAIGSVLNALLTPDHDELDSLRKPGMHNIGDR